MVLFCADVLATERSGAATTAAIYTPNIHAKSMTIPEAAGASGNVVFIGGGGTYQSAYSNRPDGAIVFGYGLGNAQKLGVQLMLNSLNMDKWDQYSFSAHVFRELNDYRAIGMGVESIPLTSGGDAPVSYYAVYSAGVQNRHFINKNDGHSKLCYSIGAGSGRFAYNSPVDVQNGKNIHGTYVFGSLAYEVAGAFNVISEWNGLNLNIGVSKTFWLPYGFPCSVIVGAADLTKYSGDRRRCIFGVGSALKLF